jgi:hypothetical protein
MIIPLALSSTGWAVVGAVGGAFVGALAGGLIDLVVSWLREGGQAKAGARLVAAQIGLMDSQLEAGEADGKWWRFYGIEISDWREYGGVLARRLDQGEFEAVSQAVVVLEHTRLQMADIPAFRKDPDLPFVLLDPPSIRKIRVEAAKGYNALSGLAGHEPEGELLTHPEQPPPRPSDDSESKAQSPG